MLSGACGAAVSVPSWLAAPQATMAEVGNSFIRSGLVALRVSVEVVVTGNVACDSGVILTYPMFDVSLYKPPVCMAINAIKKQ